ncbi:putative mucin TcMUCII [Trypanosoma cruzi]|uniref:Mucin TcMUCII, putative n=2 Tax=Trypanosoma cruzi TaxID=5693 RepID=Q4CXP1_TRYCC|nr:mucin TcMUCII, putative [Trypanosoma cruzi]EAN85044.1 mucin TcMUCII, putative [Trypanosoma cruzi]PWV03940.1 putative mucin TcMUCII [Trypanosoma cruzi]|eukprot:XP_806895.1 mucin TcMUCII [Trypanosoma cruzi strain CL Brener]
MMTCRLLCALLVLALCCCLSDCVMASEVYLPELGPDSGTEKGPVGAEVKQKGTEADRELGKDAPKDQVGKDTQNIQGPPAALEEEQDGDKGPGLKLSRSNAAVSTDKSDLTGLETIIPLVLSQAIGTSVGMSTTDAQGVVGNTVGTANGSKEKLPEPERQGTATVAGLQAPTQAKETVGSKSPNGSEGVADAPITTTSTTSTTASGLQVQSKKEEEPVITNGRENTQSTVFSKVSNSQVASVASGHSGSQVPGIPLQRPTLQTVKSRAQSVTIHSEKGQETKTIALKTSTTTTEAPTTTTTRAPSRLREIDGGLGSSAWVCAPLLLAASVLAYTAVG